MLATASIGAIWASCGPDFGSRGVVDRFLQLTPKLAFCVDGYYYGGNAFDRRPVLSVILNSLPSYPPPVGFDCYRAVVWQVVPKDKNGLDGEQAVCKIEA
jgi:acyl-coenzyme A synthetase/AMP-(fatty) acid ligase